MHLRVCRSLEAEQVVERRRRVEVISALQGLPEVTIPLVEGRMEAIILLLAGGSQEGLEVRAEAARADPLEGLAVAQVEARPGAAHLGAHLGVRQVGRREARLEDLMEDTPAVLGAGRTWGPRWAWWTGWPRRWRPAPMEASGMILISLPR